MRPRRLSEALEDLKVRSGHSYETIGRKCHASKSTVHRYCTGASLPLEFGIVERIGRVCGADREELLRLHQLWVSATSDKIPPRTEIAVPSVEVEVLAERPVRPLGLVAVLAVLTLLVAGSAPSTRSQQDSVGAQQVSGPAWELPAAPVPSTLFGVTINSGTGAMPSFRVGAVRLWDSGTRWSEIERRRGEFDWSVLDRQVAGAERAGLPVLFVFGATPRWAAPGGGATPYPDGSTSAAPDDLADWERFVGAVATRYRGRISAYELWVLANDVRYYSGNVETLVDMTVRAVRVIRAAAPDATLVCPGMGRLWESDGMGFLKRFAELGGYLSCDAAGVKLFPRSGSDPPETMLTLVDAIDRTLHEAGIHPRLWNTGTTFTIALQGALDETRARNFAVRFYLVGLYARNQNLERMYFYNWGGTKIPLVLQPVGGSPTPAALAVEQLQRWLNHAESTSCGRGPAINLPEHVWECTVTITGDRPHRASIRWTDTGTAVTSATFDVRAVHRLDGTASAIRPGDPITVTEEPVLVERS
ncbi:helix-turn-helix domain-containing protein [Lentzea terrae]|uniref:helix-turn-helix domain-containing protein n=1 Tax=Lentzea terrae TaxID=2200761 RepID=UPI000DD3533B|nr:helix-turn-helix domain-containing protein [Lentzea terrae]